MKAIDRIENERLGHVVWPIDVGHALTNLLNTAIEGRHQRTEYRAIDPLHEEWLGKVFARDIGAVLSSTLDNIGRAQLPEELKDATNHYVQQLTPPPLETQDYATYLKRLILGLESHSTGLKDKEKQHKVVGLGDGFVEPYELWNAVLGYPRVVPLFHSPGWCKNQQILYRLPHPRSKWCRTFAMLLLKLDGARMNMNLINVAAGEVAKTQLQVTDRPMSDAKRLSVQLMAIIAMYALYSMQGTLLVAHVQQALHKLLLEQSNHYYAFSRGRLSKWEQARERLLTHALHPAVRALASMMIAETTTQIGKRNLIVTLAHPDVIEKLYAGKEADLLNLFISDMASGALLKDNNKWTLDDSRKADDIDNLLIDVQDADTAILDSRCSHLFDRIASEGLGWSSVSVAMPALQLDRRQFCLTDGDSFSVDPIAAVAGFVPVLPISYVKAYQMSGFAENFFDTDMSKGQQEARPRVLNCAGAKTPKKSDGADLNPLCEFAVTTVTADFSVESTWSTLKYENEYVPAAMLMGEENIITLMSEPSYIMDPTAAEVYVHYARRSTVWASRDAIWEEMRRFVEPVPRVKSTIIMDGEDVPIGFLWGTSWIPEGSLRVRATKVGELMDFQLPSKATPTDLGTNLPQNMALNLPAFMNGEATNKLRIVVRTDGSRFMTRLPVIKTLASTYFIFSDDMQRATAYTPWVSIVYDNDYSMPASNSAVTKLRELVHVVAPMKKG